MTYQFMQEFTEAMKDAVDSARLLEVRGRVQQVNGTIIRSAVEGVKIGEMCYLRNPGEQRVTQAEVVGIADGVALLTPLGDLRGVSADTEVITTNEEQSVGVSPNMAGRVFDCMGKALDEAQAGEFIPSEYYPLHSDPPEALTRKPINEPLSLGVKAVDGFTTCGVGQRLGIYAAAGMGKSTLLAMFARNADVDVTVLVLIGERGREVKEFIDDQLGPEGIAKTVVIVATSDKPAMMRVRAAFVGTAVAEYFRDRGKKVLLLMDSVTRFARAQREIGLATGEIPTRRGYPSSVFSILPRLFERAGQSDKGSITALYTVLVEGDDMNEPVSDESRSLLDGHLILSKKLAQSGHFPAIDVPKSLSRVMDSFVSEQHVELARRLRELLVKYEEIEFLVRMGEYEEGSDPIADKAIQNRDILKELLRQGLHEKIPLSEVVEMMATIS